MGSSCYLSPLNGRLDKSELEVSKVHKRAIERVTVMPVSACSVGEYGK